MITDPENPEEQPQQFDEPILAASLEESKLLVGAKPGQAALLVNLSELPQPSQTLALLPSLGYSPELRYLETQTGLHVVAVLKDEQIDSADSIAEEALLDEWESLALRITPDHLNQAVRLWRGRSPSVA